MREVPENGRVKTIEGRTLRKTNLMADISFKEKVQVLKKILFSCQHSVELWL
jgi:hypothetical protein